MNHLRFQLKLLFALLAISCPLEHAFGSVHADSMSIRIIGRTLTDSTQLMVQISNSSSTNYYLPFIEKEEHGAYKYLHTFRENAVAGLQISYSDTQGTAYVWEDTFVVSEDTGNYDRFQTSAYSASEPEELICIPAHDSVKIRIPVRLSLSQAGHWVSTLSGYNYKNPLYINLRYGWNDDQASINQWLAKDMLAKG